MKDAIAGLVDAASKATPAIFEQDWERFQEKLKVRPPTEYAVPNIPQILSKFLKMFGGIWPDRSSKKSQVFFAKTLKKMLAQVCQQFRTEVLRVRVEETQQAAHEAGKRLRESQENEKAVATRWALPPKIAYPDEGTEDPLIECACSLLFLKHNHSGNSSNVIRQVKAAAPNTTSAEWRALNSTERLRLQDEHDTRTVEAQKRMIEARPLAHSYLAPPHVAPGQGGEIRRRRAPASIVF